MKKVILIAFALAIVGGIIFWQYAFRSTSDSVIRQKAEVHLDAKELLQAFETNESEANSAYLNKVIEVTGTVQEIAELEAGFSVYLLPEDNISGILCGFSKKAFNAKSIKAGDKVVIKGLCSGYLLDVVLNKCAWSD